MQWLEPLCKAVNNNSQLFSVYIKWMKIAQKYGKLNWEYSPYNYSKSFTLLTTAFFARIIYWQPSKSWSQKEATLLTTNHLSLQSQLFQYLLTKTYQQTLFQHKMKKQLSFTKYRTSNTNLTKLRQMHYGRMEAILFKNQPNLDLLQRGCVTWRWPYSSWEKTSSPVCALNTECRHADGLGSCLNFWT